VAIVRVEMLYPFPGSEIKAIGRRYPDAELVWAQEEPKNMGSGSYIARRIRDCAGREPRYVGRPLRASPAEGYAATHETEQNRLTAEAVTMPARRTSRKR